MVILAKQMNQPLITSVCPFVLLNLISRRHIERPIFFSICTLAFLQYIICQAYITFNESEVASELAGVARLMICRAGEQGLTLTSSISCLVMAES